MEQKRNENRRKRKQKQNIANICVGVFCAALIIGAFAIGKSITGNSAHNDNKAVRKKFQKKELVIETKKKEAQQSQLPDRSDFAAAPGVPAGSAEQTGEKIVYLTLDDGPSPNTQTVLDILDKYNIKATFFVTNAMPDYAGLIKTAYDKGHTIGMHTSTHDYARVYASADAYFQDLDAIAQTVQQQIGYVPCFIRFPGGSSNTVSASYSRGIMSTLVQEVQNRGYQYYDWNASSGDGGVHTADELAAQATSFSDNNIVLLSHDSAAKQSTVEALPRIIEHYQGLGYTFKALDRQSYAPHHGVNN